MSEIPSFKTHNQTKFKRYLVFQYENYHAQGGWNDFVNSYDSIDEASRWKDAKHVTQIVDLYDGTVIER